MFSSGQTEPSGSGAGKVNEVIRSHGMHPKSVLEGTGK